MRDERAKMDQARDAMAVNYDCIPSKPSVPDRIQAVGVDEHDGDGLVGNPHDPLGAVMAPSGHPTPALHLVLEVTIATTPARPS